MPSPLSLKEFQRPILTAPEGHGKVLLHSCCAPCSGEVIEAVRASGLDLTVYFYNPNIHPREEYELRKAENTRFAEKHSIPFVDADYDTDNWFARAKGLEREPERGARCTMCFDMRFERTALYAHENGFPVITSCLGISDQRLRPPRSVALPGDGLLDLELAQEGRRATHGGNFQARAILYAGVLWLRLFPSRYQ
jgi:epoxyqueuosine reductase